jgi:hypothetical protein
MAWAACVSLSMSFGLGAGFIHNMTQVTTRV